MYRICRFGVVKTATMFAVIYVIVIAIFAVPAAIIVLALAPSGGAGAVEVVIGGVLIAIIYAVVGWIFTAIGCAIYNLAARWIGGIEVQVEPVVPPPPVPLWAPNDHASTWLIGDATASGHRQASDRGRPET